jgi:tRNA(Arg) A34 adenosine deaminase TadA/mannose-6-phosphate isomerase-like protein (cupin superfamily)
MTDYRAQKDDDANTHNEQTVFPALTVADLNRLAASVDQAYRNFVVLDVNSHCVRLAVMKGESRWHRHPDSDECFLVLEGELEIDLADGQALRLKPGEACTIPKGVVHRTRSRVRAVNLCFEDRSAYTAVIFEDPGATSQTQNPPTMRDETREGDHRHLRRAIALAAAAREAGDQPYGSLLVGPDGHVLAEDRNTVVTERDITGHPELKLARWAARKLNRATALGTTLYTSCEPCAMCANAIARAGLGRVVFALAGNQLPDLKPAGAAAPDATRVDYQGPALFEEARVPFDGYYG